MKSLRGHSPLFITSSILVLLILLPTFTLVSELISPVGEHWEHIKTFLLEDYVLNTLALIVGVGLITSVFGTFFSWMLSHYKFKWHKFGFLLLFLPMAIPPYIGGYIYGGIFNYGGTLERIFRAFSLQPIRVDMLSRGGAIFVFSLFLMPYVVLVTRTFFDRLPSSYFESSKLLGKDSAQTFFKIILPLSRGAIIGGSVLVILEVLNDYGLVKYFGVPTFSTAIYTTWFGLGDISSAIRLAAILMIIVFVILSAEFLSRGRGRVNSTRSMDKVSKQVKPSKKIKIVFYVSYIIYITLSIIIPLAQLVSWSMMAKYTNLNGMFLVVKDTILLATGVTIIVIVSGLIIGNMNRLSTSLISKFYTRVVVLGYSIPASIIAVAVMTFFIGSDRVLQPIYQVMNLKNNFLAASLTMLIFALSLRFMAIGYNSIESGYRKIGLKYYQASKLLGKSELKTFFLIDLPMLKTAIISASILTFVDVLKELPLTLILRPFNYSTLATKVFTYAGDEMIHEASVYALIIIGISAVSLIILMNLKRSRHD